MEIALKLKFSMIIIFSTLIGCSSISTKESIKDHSFYSNFEDQKTRYEDVVEKIGKPNKYIEVDHRFNTEYEIEGKTYCIYFDGSSLIWATDNKKCSDDSTYLPEKSLTSSKPDKSLIY